MNDLKFTEVFSTMRELEDVQSSFIHYAEQLGRLHNKYNVFFKTDVRIDVDSKGMEVPELTCTLKISKKNEHVNYL